jgi:hypothetical protein
MIKKSEWKARKNLLNDICFVCKKKFKLGDRFILCPIQESLGDNFINAVAIPIHTDCYYIEEKK